MARDASRKLREKGTLETPRQWKPRSASGYRLMPPRRWF
jgi:hypothetical protein